MGDIMRPDGRYRPYYFYTIALNTFIKALAYNPSALVQSVIDKIGMAIGY